MSSAPSAHARWLWTLAGLFAVRVVAQPLAAATGWRVLPPFAAWQSGALPYGVLLTTQVLLLTWTAWTARAVAAGRLVATRRVGRALAAIAAVYGALMSARLVLGATAFRGHWWLDAPLPTVFHLVITTYLAVLAHHHLREASDHDSRT